jgi:hypothetical protein
VSQRISVSANASSCRPAARILRAYDHQQVKHVLVQHVPGADLLFNHIKAGLFNIHLMARWEK